MGSDEFASQWRRSRCDFNPRSPYGERPTWTDTSRSRCAFQSTLPIWGATSERRATSQKEVFQSTLPVWGATRICGARCPSCGNFNPRSPYGERPYAIDPRYVPNNFNPRSPYGERHHVQRRIDDGRRISIHAPRMGSDPHGWSRQNPRTIFQSTLPVWGATTRQEAGGAVDGISIHAPRMGSDRTCSGRAPRRKHFNPRSPYGERPQGRPARNQGHGISIHAPRMGSDGIARTAWPQEEISIHAPRMGSDTSASAFANRTGYFNPRSPYGERRQDTGAVIEAKIFQSTLPVWGATRDDARPRRLQVYFNPRSPYGERQRQYDSKRQTAQFQSTLPVWGATERAAGMGIDVEFQSTLPVWGATCGDNGIYLLLEISIHAPRMGSDDAPAAVHNGETYFNPRSPYGERHIMFGTPIPAELFQSTLPVWGATPLYGRINHDAVISIHAPRMGSDLFDDCIQSLLRNFNPRSPYGERLECLPTRYLPNDFNPRSPYGERRRVAVSLSQLAAFQSTLPVWGATLVQQTTHKTALFQSTLPVWGATMMVASLAPHFFVFQSTLPVWGATRRCDARDGHVFISIHAPRMGSDPVPACVVARIAYFNPRSPYGERLCSISTTSRSSQFQSTLPVWGATNWSCLERPVCEFQSTLPVWGATHQLLHRVSRLAISIHAPRMGSDPRPWWP